MPLSPQLTATPAFPVTASESLFVEQIPYPRLIAATAVSLILAFAAADAALRGPWLDEIWTLELSDTRNGLLALTATPLAHHLRRRSNAGDAVAASPRICRSLV